jgi:hypothetical protein
MVDTTGISTLDFDLTAAQEQTLFDSGQAAAQRFLAQQPAR